MKKRSPRAFTLIELLVVITIIAILAAILVPVIRNMNLKSMETKAISNLKQHGLAFNLFAAERDGYLPSATNNDIPGAGAYTFWLYALKPYYGITDDAELGRIIHDPYYYKLIGTPILWWKPGWGMNARMGLAVGDSTAIFNNHPITGSSFYVSYKAIRYPGNTVLLGPAFSEGFNPKNDGTVADTQFSKNNSTPVPHTKRIGADSEGLGGKSALYLYLDGSVHNLTPEEAAEVLKLRPQ